MVVYSIKDMENLSGVKAHTLRIWEKRYGLIQPKRTESNIRYYTEEDLRHLLNITILIKQGIKISKIAELTPDEIISKVNLSSESIGVETNIDTLLLYILDFDENNLSKVFDMYIDQIGWERTMIELIYPLLEKLSLAWLTGAFQNVHESFVVQLIKSKIIYGIASTPQGDESAPLYVTYLASGEEQELSVLYTQLILRKIGCRVVNLGLDVNLQDLLSAIYKLKPDFVFTIMNESLESRVFQNYLNQISKNIENGTYIITGFQAVSHNLEWPNNVRILKTLDETLGFFKSSVQFDVAK